LDVELLLKRNFSLQFCNFQSLPAAVDLKFDMQIYQFRCFGGSKKKGFSKQGQNHTINITFCKNF